MATAALQQPVQPVFLHPDELPDFYAAIGRGTCMEPDVPDGTCLGFAKNAPVAPGDLVGIWRRPGTYPADEPQQLLKRLVMGPPEGMRFPFNLHPDSNAAPAVVVEMLNPRRPMMIDCSTILAIHKCLGAVERIGGRAVMPRAWMEPGP
jgi:hypothetical protein